MRIDLKKKVVSLSDGLKVQYHSREGLVARVAHGCGSVESLGGCAHLG